MSKNYNSLHIEKDGVDADFDTIESPYGGYEQPTKRTSTLPLSITVALGLIVLICVTSFPNAARSILSRTADSTFEVTSDETAAKVKPNFVFLLADDLGAFSMGYDDKVNEYVTPFMTSLAKKGIILSNYYSQEVCSPARASLMTGRYPATVGLQFGEVMAKSNLSLDISEMLLPQVLKTNGNYVSYALGKWNLGHHTPEYLPTARGFNYFLGYLDGHSYYWSKLDPSATNMTDLMYADGECYAKYGGDDYTDYSTLLYTKKALKAIEVHNFNNNPMFLYMAYQAVHDPFEDDGNLLDEEYVGQERYNRVMTAEAGGKRQQYLMALMLIDDSVSMIYKALENQGQIDNTYFIFASDNGGLTSAGGRNGDLRGGKGTLFEGGTKVDAFVYSTLLTGSSSSSSGIVYDGLMHVSDWMPTMLGWAGVVYHPDVGHTLDGVDQSKTMLLSSSERAQEARSLMLYNIYLNVEGPDFDLDTNAPFAIRNSEGFKLIHAFNGSEAGWFSVDALYEFDDNLAETTTGSQIDSMLSGNYTMYLFDLNNDPNERNNLYDDPAYTDVKNELYSAIYELSPKRMAYTETMSIAQAFFTNHDEYVQPFYFQDLETISYPVNSCDATHVFSP